MLGSALLGAQFGAKLGIGWGLRDSGFAFLFYKFSPNLFEWKD